MKFLGFRSLLTWVSVLIFSLLSSGLVGALGIKNAGMDIATSGLWRISVTMTPEPSDTDREALQNVSHWRVTDSQGVAVPISKVELTADNQPKVYITWDEKVALRVAFGDQDPVMVVPLDLSKVAGMNLEPVPSPKVSFQQDASKTSGGMSILYDFELPFVTPGPDYVHLGHWAGGLATTGELTIGDLHKTNISAYLSGDQYFVEGLPRIYRLGATGKLGSDLSGTVKDPVQTVSMTASLDLAVEIPYSDVPFLALHRITGYTRATMPLTVDLVPAVSVGTDGAIAGKVSATATYELSFHPLFNIQPVYSYGFDFSSKAWTSDLQLKVGAALGYLSGLGLPADSGHNFAYLSYGWSWTASGANTIPVAIGFSTVF
jgi:hypothetical protein